MKTLNEALQHMQERSLFYLTDAAKTRPRTSLALIWLRGKLRTALYGPGLEGEHLASDSEPEWLATLWKACGFVDVSRLSFNSLVCPPPKIATRRVYQDEGGVWWCETTYACPNEFLRSLSDACYRSIGLPWADGGEKEARTSLGARLAASASRAVLAPRSDRLQYNGKILVPTKAFYPSIDDLDKFVCDARDIIEQSTNKE